jgi:carboxylesterase type B
MTPARDRHLAREMKLLAHNPGTSGEPRSVRHRHLAALFSIDVIGWSVGDVDFQASRRLWSQTTFAPSYAYIFTDPQPNADPAVGVFHGVELPYIFGGLAKSGPPKVARLSRAMLDYWISFAVSLTPNDGKGTSSML